MAPPPAREARRAANVTLPEGLVREARALGINLSQACERGVAAEVARVRARQWQEENRAAMDAWNEHVAREGLPLAKYRRMPSCGRWTCC